MKNYFFTIFMPCYNASKTIEDTLNSIFHQTYQNFEIVIQDNHSTDNTLKIISKYNSPKIKLYKNKRNIGYIGSLQTGIKKCKGEIHFLIASDDILSSHALELFNQAFNLQPNIGAVTRPYFWFNQSYKLPIRQKKILNPTKNEIVNITDDINKVICVFNTLDQLSGLAYKSNLVKINFGREKWIPHAYPFLSIFSKYPIVFVKDHILAVRTTYSATKTNCYQKSPILYWVNLINLAIKGKHLTRIKNEIIQKFVAKNYIGLVQIKNYGSTKSLYKEIYYLIKLRPLNLLNLKFWLYILLVIFTPKKLLSFFTEYYKDNILVKLLPKIKFKTNISFPSRSKLLAKPKPTIFPIKK